jgi:beta-galactosidase
LRDLLRIRITQVASLRPGLIEGVKGKVAGKAERWREYLETKAEVLARFVNDDAALIANANHHYLACWPDEKLLHATMGLLCKKAKLKPLALPPHIRVRQRGDYLFAFNYGTKNWALPAKVKLVLGKKSLEPQAVSIWRK